MFEQFLEDAAALRNTYWFIRYQRCHNRRRKFYRKAAKEKAALRGLGWDDEAVRLYCLYLRDTSREHRFYRFRQAFDEALNGPKQLRLFA